MGQTIETSILSWLGMLIWIKAQEAKLLGIDLLDMFQGGSGVPPSSRTGTEYTIPGGETDVEMQSY
jgi:hypothetical protein